MLIEKKKKKSEGKTFLIQRKQQETVRLLNGVGGGTGSGHKISPLRWTSGDLRVILYTPGSVEPSVKLIDDALILRISESTLCMEIFELFRFG